MQIFKEQNPKHFNWEGTQPLPHQPCFRCDCAPRGMKCIRLIIIIIIIIIILF